MQACGERKWSPGPDGVTGIHKYSEIGNGSAVKLESRVQ